MRKPDRNVTKVKYLIHLFVALCVVSGPVLAAKRTGTLSSLMSAEKIVIAYAPNALPFSFKRERREPVGYSIALCKRIVAGIQRQLRLSKLNIEWVPGTTPERLKMVVNGTADMECGTTTVTLSRQERVDFSNLVFVASGGVLVKSGSNIGAFADLARKRIAVIPGTTTAKRLDEVLKERVIRARLVHVRTAKEAMSSLESGRADAYASDRAMLLGQVFLSGRPNEFNMLREQFSIDPYAFAMRRGDADFRLAVNRSLADLYRTGEIATVFSRSFGPEAKPTVLLKSLYLLNALQD